MSLKILEQKISFGDNGLLKREKTIVAAGTLNRAKLRGISRAWKLFGDARIISTKIETGIEAQPISWYHTVRGALERAKKSMETVPNAEYGVGIEAGLLPFPSPSGYMEAQIAVILDREYSVSLGMSMAFEVPYKLVGELTRGEELGILAEKTFKRKNIGETLGVIGILTKGNITRTDLTYQAVLSALIPRMNPKSYPSLKKLGWYKQMLEEQSF